MFTITLLPAQEIPGRYIVELTEQPPAASPAKTLRRAAVVSQQRSARAAVAGRGAQITDSVQTVANALIVNATSEQAAEIAKLPEVAYVEPVREMKLYLDRAVLVHKVTDAWASIGGQGNAGAGIKIGIIDTGIDNTHPAFQDSSLSEVPGFPKAVVDADLKYTNRKIIVARNYSGSSAKDVRGHGTGVAMIAAGGTSSAPLGSITGFAPKAYLGSYKVFGDDGGAASSDVLKALDDAVADGMDVINLSLGGFPARRPADDAQARAVERATAAGVLVVVAAGNEGPDSATVGTPATASSAIAVGNSWNDRVFATLAKLEGQDPFTSIPGNGPQSVREVTGPVVDVFSLDPTGLACAPLPANTLRGAIALVYRGTCNFEDKLTYAQKAGAIAALVYARADNPDAISMAVGASTLPAMMVSNRDGQAIRGALQNRTASLTLFFEPQAVSVNPYQLAGSSSRGPGSDGTLKPDLLAIGTSVYTASPLDSSSKGYTLINGTSFSAPMVAGAAAVLKAARPGLTAYQYRSLVINSTGALNLQTPLSVQQTGTGILNLASAVQSSISAVPTSLALGVGGGSVDVLRSFNLTNLSKESESYALFAEPALNSIQPQLSADAVSLGPGESRTITLRLHETNLEPGEYSGFVNVRGTRTESQARVAYWYGVPSETPARLYVDSQVPESGKVSSSQSILIRVSDKFGNPLLVEPTATVEAGSGVIKGVTSIDSVYPGFYVVAVKLGAEKGSNTYAIGAGSLSTKVTIVGN